MRKINNLTFLYIAGCLIMFTSCKKLLEISPPRNSITTNEMFTTNKQAEWAINGIYSKMINGVNYNRLNTAGLENFAAGLSTLMGGLSSDEMSIIAGNGGAVISENKLTKLNSSQVDMIWETAYRIIYDATAAIEGLEASTSPSLADSVKTQLLGEALVLRAFSYFYLVNFYGDLPLVLTTDFKKTIGISRSPVTKVYDQIKIDLAKALPFLSSDFSVGKNERIRVNRWVAEALMARVYLYTGEYQLAINHATAVIDQPGLFSIEQNLETVFQATSKEAIFQLKPAMEEPVFFGTTPEALMFYQIPGPTDTWEPIYRVSSLLFNAFEPNDKRKINWITSIPGAILPSKYKPNAQISSYTVIRLAEMFLIRAEATVLLTPSAKDNAIDDLNVLRRRAGVDELDKQLTAAQVKDAVAHERRLELFCEWGHRWFDLKRTGAAATVLPAISWKQPWWGNYQLLYPIPGKETSRNNNLIQNPEYDAR